MDKVNYMVTLPQVARELGEGYGLATLGSKLTSSWGDFEVLADRFSFDLFNPDTTLGESMEELTKLLYLVPHADWSADVLQIQAKDRDYGGSWCKRGGANAFFMLVRKWDRIETALKMKGNLANAIGFDERDEGILDDLGDLRRYLLLVQSWRMARDRANQEQTTMEF